jgi:hypothetical protein
MRRIRDIVMTLFVIATASWLLEFSFIHSFFHSMVQDLGVQVARRA